MTKFFMAIYRRSMLAAIIVVNAVVAAMTRRVDLIVLRKTGTYRAREFLNSFRSKWTQSRKQTGVNERHWANSPG